MKCGFNEAEGLNCASRVFLLLRSICSLVLSGFWLLSCLWLSGTEVHDFVFASPAGEAETPVDMETISLDPEAEVKADFCPYGLYAAGGKGRQRQVLKPD